MMHPEAATLSEWKRIWARQLAAQTMACRFYALGSILALAAVYFFCGKFGLALAFVNKSASAVWPPTGLALAALVLWGYRLWPGVFLGAFLVNLTTQGSLATTLGIATGNTLEALLGAWLVSRFANGLRAFEGARSIFTFVLLAAILSPVVSATIGVTSLHLGGFAPTGQHWAIWLTWWLGDTVSDVIFAPLLLVWIGYPMLRLKPKQILEGAGLLLTLVLVGGVIFLRRNPLGTGNYPLEYLAVLPLLWAALRFGSLGALTSAFVMSGIALWGTLRGAGPFATADNNESLLLLQAYVGTTTLTVLVLASVVSERRKAQQRLEVQDAVSLVLAEASTIEEAAPRILEALCEKGRWEVGAMWNLDPTTNELFCVEVWHLPSIGVAQFEPITRQTRLSPGIGLPGRALSTGKPVWVADVTKDSNFPRALVAEKEGLHAAFSFPLKPRAEVLCVMECFSREIRQPDKDFLRMVAEIGSRLGQFIERKRAEVARQRSEALRGAILESAMDCIISIDRKGAIIEFNGPAEKTFGYSRNEALGKPLVQLIIPPRLREKHHRGLAHYLAAGDGPVVGKRIEVPALRRDGTEIPVELSIYAAQVGTERIFTANLRDITDRKRAEEALKTSQQELQEINQELDQRIQQRTARLQQVLTELEAFSYSISHDLRAPLRAIQGFSTALLESTADKLNAEELEDLRRIASASRRMDNLIRDVLSYSQAARGEITLVPVDLDKLTRDLIENDPALQQPHAEISIQGKLPLVLAHQASLTQCVCNLLGNAVKFISPGTFPRVKVWAEAVEGQSRVCFQDNGIGIAPKDKERIFRVFSRLHPAERYGGTGIGLSIVKKATERMGGKVGLESEPGQGSKFWIQLSVPPSG